MYLHLLEICQPLGVIRNCILERNNTEKYDNVWDQSYYGLRIYKIESGETLAPLETMKPVEVGVFLQLEHQFIRYVY